MWSYRFWLCQFSFKLTKCNVNLILEANTANKNMDLTKHSSKLENIEQLELTAHVNILIGRYATTEAVPITSTE